MAITRTPMIDDDGSGNTGTIINNAWKTELYNQIDAALGPAAGIPAPGAAGNVMTSTGAAWASQAPAPAYLTGAWTPTLIDFSGGSAAAYSARSGTFVRVGALVMVTGRIALTNKGTLTAAVGALLIDGLPYPVVKAGAVAISYFNGLSLAVSSLVGAMGGDGSMYFTFLYTAGPQVATLNLFGTHITNTFDVWFTGTYATNP